jgi:hypothetical protein
MDVAPSRSIVGGEIDVQKEFYGAADNLPAGIANHMSDDVGRSLSFRWVDRIGPFIGREHHGSEVGDIGGLRAETGGKKQYSNWQFPHGFIRIQQVYSG